MKLFKRKTVLLFWVTLDKEKYKTQGKKNSAVAKIHPYVSLLSPELQLEIEQHINAAVDLIRDNLDVEKL